MTTFLLIIIVAVVAIGIFVLVKKGLNKLGKPGDMP